jgi:hypothetical protein
LSSLKKIEKDSSLTPSSNLEELQNTLKSIQEFYQNALEHAKKFWGYSLYIS